MTKEEAVIISAYTGFLLVDNFADVHEFIEKLLGRPVWTHQFADPALIKEIREKCKPILPTVTAEREDPQPLTIDELRQMNGLPVWVQELSGLIDNTGWALVEVDDSGVYKGVPFVKCHVCTWNVITRGLHCYRHKPKEVRE